MGVISHPTYLLLINLIQSLHIKQSPCEIAYGRNSEQEETKKVSQSAWRVLKVALLFPILGKGPARVSFSSETRIGGRGVG